MHSIHDGRLKQLSVADAKQTERIWLDLKSPTEEDLRALESLIHIPPEVITDIKDVNEVPKLDRVDGYLYILLQTPLASPEADQAQTGDIAYATAPIALLLNDRMLVTVSWGDNDVIAYLKNKLKNVIDNRIVDTDKLPQMALKFFLFTAKIYLRYLKDIHNRLDIPFSEHTIATFDQDVMDLLKIEQSLVYFDASVRSNYIVIEKISRRKPFKDTAEDQELLDDVLDESRQAVEVVNVYSHIVEDVRSALSSLISNHLTRTVNWLTKVTVILMFPTFVATLYGMNVPLPFAHSHYAFWIVLAMSFFAACLGMWWLWEGKVVLSKTPVSFKNRSKK